MRTETLRPWPPGETLPPSVHDIFYKAKGMRPKDQTDFDAVLPTLDRGQLEWLASALTLVHGDHPWVRRISAVPGADPPGP